MRKNCSHFFRTTFSHLNVVQSLTTVSRIELEEVIFSANYTNATCKQNANNVCTLCIWKTANVKSLKSVTHYRFFFWAVTIARTRRPYFLGIYPRKLSGLYTRLVSSQQLLHLTVCMAYSRGCVVCHTALLGSVIWDPCTRDQKTSLRWQFDNLLPRPPSRHTSPRLSTRVSLYLRNDSALCTYVAHASRGKNAVVK